MRPAADLARAPLLAQNTSIIAGVTGLTRSPDARQGFAIASRADRHQEYAWYPTRDAASCGRCLRHQPEPPALSGRARRINPGKRAALHNCRHEPIAAGSRPCLYSRVARFHETGRAPGRQPQILADADGNVSREGRRMSALARCIQKRRRPARLALSPLLTIKLSEAGWFRARGGGAW